MKRLLAITTAALALAAPVAFGQTLNVMKSGDAPHFDGHKAGWSAAADVVNLVQDTLVALDWDGKTSIPLLAKSWTVSPDGKLYTFKLRDDVQFCSGKKFTAADVVYSFNRQRDPATRAPYAWRAGKIKELRAPDPYTVEYELLEPYSDLLLQLTMYNNAIHNKDSVDALGKDYGLKGLDGTGPWCWVSWQPRTETVLKRHDAYRWGPTMYKNPGPVKFEKMSIKVVPEDSSRLAAMLGGRFDVTTNFPLQFIEQAKKSPIVQVDQAKPNFQLMMFAYRMRNRPLVADRRVREAMNLALNRADMVKGVMLGQAEPAFTFVHPDARDFAPSVKGMVKEDVARANKLLDEAGWTKRDKDGIRMKDGVRLAPKAVIPGYSFYPRMSEAIQGSLRKVGIDWQIIPIDVSAMVGRLGPEDYDMWTVTVPYMSAGELMTFYFDSANIPVPNRSFWNDAITDAGLKEGRTAITDADRARGFAKVQERVTSEHLMMPIMYINMYMTSNRKLKNARAHMLFQQTIYKGLDLSF